ncbi:MAG: S-methyl-5-thioribose-1-phosphate isomerase [Gemmatimonadota bacterium]|nr:S-methyl-5-thioribose-1-phosphate isomerase [Gemmatimonadota bacterium]
MPSTAPLHIGWTPSRSVRILDQTRLPGEERYLDITTISAMVEAIYMLRVRGAPLIGVAAAMGATLVGRRGEGGVGGGAVRLEEVMVACDQLEAARPTAVNLPWAMNRMRNAARAGAAAGRELYPALLAEAEAIWAEDQRMCQLIGEAGLPLLADGSTVLTHCNAGSLATGGIGTALAPVYLAHAAGRRIAVVADETRPLLQGGRLTAWELTRAGVPCTVITDGMAPSRLRKGDVTCVIVGADRIARNGDVANKIGTYGVALAARAHGVPFYVAAPRSTFDFATQTGAGIHIEERQEDEVRRPGGPGAGLSVPEAALVWNPAFDVTPAALISGYITDAGLLTRQELGRLDPGS